MNNVWFVHADVNRAKGTLSAARFMDMCRAVSEYRSADGSVGDDGTDDGTACDTANNEKR